MYNDVITLIQVDDTAVDAYGDRQPTLKRRDVFAEVCSIGQSEFYQANANGLKPEKKFRLADYLDYSGEMIIEHEGETFHILRTYRKGQELELVVYKEVNKK